MQRKLFFVLVLTVLIPAVLFAAGKIRGKVTDAGTGEPLVGANVVIMGTTMGAATNVAGEFTILNVETGTYTLKTSYVGYQTITLSNIRVNEGLTAEADFKLPAEGVTVGTVEIVAERPLINKSATNAVRIIDSDFFDKIPARGVAAAIAIQPGVVVQGGGVYIRGGRADEVGYRVEGANVTDILTGGNGLYTTAEAVEQIQVQAGGFSAEFGGANAGIIQTQLRSGSSERWRATLLGETDNFTSQQKEALGGYSYGYSDWTATLGGPILGKTLRFFGSVQNTFFRDPNVSVRDAYDFTNLITDPAFTPKHPTVARADTIAAISMGANSIGGMNARWSYSGTLLLDMGSLQVRAAGTYTTTESRNTTYFFQNLDQERLGLNQYQNMFANLKVSYVFSPTTYLEVNGNWYGRQTKNMDPYWQDDIFSYGDSLKNAALGYYYYREGVGYSNYSFYNGAITGLSQPGQNLSGYYKDRTDQFGGRADFTAQMKQHEIKIGGEYTQSVYRRYNPAGEFSWSRYAKQAASQEELVNLLNLAAGTGSDIIGYDILGNPIDNDVVINGATYYFAPPKPVFAAAYIQDKIEFSDIIINLGLRWDYINPDSKTTADPGNLTYNADGLLVPSVYEKTPSTSALSPRIGFSFPVTDRTVFHAQYGKFIQQSRLNDSYFGAAAMSGNSTASYWVSDGARGWGLEPERTTAYELGFSQVVSDQASFDITAFYKDIQNQIQYVQIQPTPGTSTEVYAALQNKDFTTAQGIEAKFILRRTNRVSAQINYTFSDVRSTATDQAGSNGIWQLGLPPSALPHFVFPTNFDQAHRGALLLDYRFGKGDGGPILEQLGANLLLTFNSGHKFTQVTDPSRAAEGTDERRRAPTEAIGSSTTPWFFQLDMRIDKTVAIGPLDVNFFIYAINLLGTDNVINVFSRSGDAKSDGYFLTTGGYADVASLGQGFADMWTTLYNGRNSGNFGPPRQIRFGLRLEY
jgi:outer membrane receptor protein involved in Fe transport